MGFQESQPLSQRTGSPTALAASASRPPGGPGSSAQDATGAASAPGTSSRDGPHPAAPTQPPLQCHPEPGGQCWYSCHSGHSVYCSGPTAVLALRVKWPPRRVRRRGGPRRPARRGGGARRHREKLLGGEEAVGGGRRRWVGEAIALLSLQSRKYSPQLVEPGAEASEVASCASVCVSARRLGNQRLPGRRRLRAGTSAPRGCARRPRPGPAWRRRTRPRPRRPRAPTHRPRPQPRAALGFLPSVLHLPERAVLTALLLHRRLCFPPPALCFPPAPRWSLCRLRSPAAVGSPGSQRLID